MRDRGEETAYALCDATWPAKSQRVTDGWCIREGAGGGKRVSAATALQRGDLPEISAAESAMEALGQDRLFMIRSGENPLDLELEMRGYARIDPVNIYACPTADLATEIPPRLSSFTLYPPLALMKELWAEGGIGPGRLAVMDRATGSKTTILGRAGNRVGGTAYVAVHGDCAMLHALEVDPAQRRRKVAVNIMRTAAHWALDHDAGQFYVLVTADNQPANALYSFLNMRPVGHYHYRIKAA